MFMQLLAGALISGGLGLLKGVFGGVQASRASKQQKNLLANRPTYTIPEYYQKAYGTAQQMAAQDMPGMEKYKDMYAEATARSISAAERGAISSNTYLGAVQTAQDKELQALQQLATMGANYKVQAMQNLQQAQNKMGELQDVSWEMNRNRPWQEAMNRTTENRQAGMQNLFGGLSDIGGSIMNFVGTKYYTDVMKDLYPKNG